MAYVTLPGTTYNPSALRDQRLTINTIIDEEPQDGTIIHFTIDAKSPPNDNITPRATKELIEASPISVGSSSYTSDSDWSRGSRSSGHSDAFNELYDVTDDESESMEVPFKISNSVKSQVARRRRTARESLPSLVIPSPGAWPTIEKYKQGIVPALPAKLALSPELLSKIHTRNLEVPQRSTTPSLDGSLTSEELAASSCPSTPNLSAICAERSPWGVQLDPEVMQTLHAISPERHEERLAQTIELPQPEMFQVAPGERPRSLGLTTTPLERDPDADLLSALSVPSPGGFFASLGNNARHTWNPSSAKGLDTSTAESFYNLPWSKSPGNIVEQTLIVKDVESEDELTARQAPSTAQRIPETPTEVREIECWRPAGVFEYDEQYQHNLKSLASANLDRTGSWLNQQESYLNTLIDNCADKAAMEAHIISPVDSVVSPKSALSSGVGRKKSVRFADSVAGPKPKTPKSPTDDNGLFYTGFRHLQRQSRTANTNPFVASAHRNEALHIQRQTLSKQHRASLRGEFTISSPTTVAAPSRPISSFLPQTEEHDELRAELQAVQKERRALEQLQPAAWNVEALRILNGGRLLASPAAAALKHPGAAVLDLGGEPLADWAWSIAASHPRAHVTTACSAASAAHAATVQGPTNHSVKPVPNLWTLPFASGSFDVVSARSLHCLLHSSEYDRVLSEALRVLRPGGSFEFSLLDAELLRPGPAGHALGAEFAFCLRQRGYDPAPSRAFIKRLRAAGFGTVKRAWMVLPCGDVRPRFVDNGKAKPAATGALRRGGVGSLAERKRKDAVLVERDWSVQGTKHVSGLTGLAGAWAWEKWILKLGVEAGKEEERLLDGVDRALEEGGKVGAGWRVLTGWARKPEERCLGGVR